MKKSRKSSKKGFTLVELIVVLVILAILAAMLVPALTGYIRRARQEKDYQMASTVLTAAQAAATYQYSKDQAVSAVNQSTLAGPNSADTVAALVGTPFTSCSFAVSNGVVTSGTVTINGNTYSYTYSNSAGQPEWTASSSTT